MSLSNAMMDLNKAIYKRDINCIKEILLNNTTLLQDHKWNFLPLNNAILLDNNEEIVELLVKQGGNVNLQNPLEIALEKSSIKCIELLLKNGAKFKDPWTWKSPAQNFFDRTDRKEILQLLLKYGVDASLRKKNCENLLNLFLRHVERDDHGAADFAKIILDSARVSLDEPDENLLLPIDQAIGSRNIQLVSFLISEGADITGSDPIIEAVLQDDVEIIDLLLSKGANIHSKDKYGCTVLHHACEYNRSVISFLLQKGVNISEEDNNGESPFSFLDPEQGYYDECVIDMVKEFAKLSFEKFSISKKDMNLIQANPKAQEHFQLCTKELNLMASTEFLAPHSFYSILKKSKAIKKLANLAKNEELVLKFNTKLQNLYYYKNDLQRNWEEVIRVRDNSEEVFSRLHSIFHNYLPSVVIKILSKNLKLEDFLV